MTAYVKMDSMHNGIMLARIDLVRENLLRIDMYTLLSELEELRGMAVSRNMSECVVIIRSFESALARSRCNTMALHYLNVLADSVGISPHSSGAAGTLLASLAVYGVR